MCLVKWLLFVDDMMLDLKFWRKLNLRLEEIVREISYMII